MENKDLKTEALNIIEDILHDSQSETTSLEAMYESLKNNWYNSKIVTGDDKKDEELLNSLKYDAGKFFEFTIKTYRTPYNPFFETNLYLASMFDQAVCDLLFGSYKDFPYEKEFIMTTEIEEKLLDFAKKQEISFLKG